MSDREQAKKEVLLEWGVRPLPKNERHEVRQGVGAKPQAMPIKPPAGGTGVPPVRKPENQSSKPKSQ